MVLIPDPLTDLLEKGEVTERYYNPGNLFAEVHLVLVNSDVPDVARVKAMVGNAELYIHNLPAGTRTFLTSLAWRPALLQGWARRAVELARKVRPQLVRCHGNHLNAFAAREIKRVLGIPYVISLHINPDADVRPHATGIRNRVAVEAQRTIEKVSLREADLVLPVYKPIIPYLERLRVERYEVAYNVLNPTNLIPKEDYELHQPVRVICTGRQIPQKNPTNLIKAVASLSGIQLTVVGDGVLHDHLRELAQSTKASDRIVFHRAIPNDELCRLLPTFDIYAIHTDYWEISKSLLEALLTGLPCIVNKRPGQPVPELETGLCVLVDNNVSSYREGLRKLVEQPMLRRDLGTSARERAWEKWSPEVTERRFVEIYQRIASSQG